MTWYSANFGSNKAGLANVGYREYDNTGGDAVARTETGVIDAGNGMYGVDVTLNAATVGLQWDTGEAVPVFANEDINQLADIDGKIDIIDANVDLVILGITQILVDVAAVKADTDQLLLDVAALNAQNVLILADTTQLLLDTTAILAQNVAILLDTAQILADVATVDGKVDQILLDTTQLLLDTIALGAQNVLIFADTQMLRDIEDGHDIREILRLIVASANNILSGAEAGSTQITLKSLGGAKNRQVTNVDDDGNRLSIVSRDFTP